MEDYYHYENKTDSGSDDWDSGVVIDDWDKHSKVQDRIKQLKNNYSSRDND